MKKWSLLAIIVAIMLLCLILVAQTSETDNTIPDESGTTPDSPQDAAVPTIEQLGDEPGTEKSTTNNNNNDNDNDNNNNNNHNNNDNHDDQQPQESEKDKVNNKKIKASSSSSSVVPINSKRKIRSATANSIFRASNITFVDFAQDTYTLASQMREIGQQQKKLRNEMRKVMVGVMKSKECQQLLKDSSARWTHQIDTLLHDLSAAKIKLSSVESHVVLGEIPKSLYDKVKDRHEKCTNAVTKARKNLASTREQISKTKERSKKCSDLSEELKVLKTNKLSCLTKVASKNSIVADIRVDVDNSNLDVQNQQNTVATLEKQLTLMQQIYNIGASGDSNPQPSGPHFSSCREIYLARSEVNDGTYVIKPHSSLSPISVYCDMKRGGWTLIAMVHAAFRDNVPENPKWFINGQNQDPLSSNSVKMNSIPSSFGANTWKEYLSKQSNSKLIVKFELEAGDIGSIDPLDVSLLEKQRVYMYKEAPWESFSHWFYDDTVPTTVCLDENLTQKCVKGQIRYGYGQRATNIEGPYQMHMRQDGDEAQHASGVCSALNLDNQDPKGFRNLYYRWWGNTLRLWIK